MIGKRTLVELIEAFVSSLQARGVSPHTVRGYGQDLRLFATTVPARLSKVSNGDIEAFVTERGYADSTHRRRRASLRIFCRWLEEEGLRCPAAAAPEPEPLDLADIDAYLLRADDLYFVQEMRSTHRLGLALMLVCARVNRVLIRDPRVLPQLLVDAVAQQMNCSTESLAGYRSAESTYNLDRVRVCQYLGVSVFSADDAQRLREHLCHLCRTSGNMGALHDEAESFIERERLLRPRRRALSRLIQAVKNEVELEYASRVEQSLSGAESAALDTICQLKTPTLEFLRGSTRRVSVASLDLETERLSVLRNLLPTSSEAWQLPVLVQRRWCTVVKKQTSRSLRRMPDARRHAMLAVFVRGRVEEITDRVVDLLDRLISNAAARSRETMVHHRAERLEAWNDSASAFCDIGEVLVDGKIPPAAVRDEVFRRVPRERICQLLSQARNRRANETRDLLSALSHRTQKLRQLLPTVLAQLDLEGTPSARGLLRTLKTLEELRASRIRELPDDFVDDFVPSRWRDDVKVDRQTVELAALLEFSAALRRGDVTVRRSRRYERWDRTLYESGSWAERREDWFEERDLPSDADAYLAARLDSLHASALAVNEGLCRNRAARVEGRRLIVRRDEPAERSPEFESLRASLIALRPRTTLPRLLYAVDRWSGFAALLTDVVKPLDEAHHRGKQREALFAVLVAEATNIGLAAMTDACGIPLDILERTRSRFFREDTLRAAIRRLLSYHASLPLASLLGPGTTSASDGERFSASSSLNARPLPRYFGMRSGVTLYSYVSDQSMQFYLDLVNSHHRDATYALDGILHRGDEMIQEHYTDTHGYSDIVFGLFELLGVDFAPHLRDLSRQILCRPRKDGDYGALNAVFRRHVRLHRIVQHWDDLHRMTASIRDQRARPSDVIRRLQASKRLNTGDRHGVGRPGPDCQNSTRASLCA